MGAAFPIAGGEYIYLRRVYGPFIGFLRGWTSFTIGFSAAIAAGAVSFAAYLLQLFPLDDEGGMRSTAFALALSGQSQASTWLASDRAGFSNGR